MINIQGTDLWFNFRHERHLPPDLPKRPVTRDELAFMLDRAINDGEDVYDEAATLLERYGVEDEGVSHISICCLYAKRADTLTPVKITGVHEPMIETLAYCSRKDNFCRETGRWWAITRMVEAINDVMEGRFQDEARAVSHGFLLAYFNRYTAEGSAIKEIKAYQQWLRTTYASHRQQSSDLVPETTIADLASIPATQAKRPTLCPVCHHGIAECDRWPVAELAEGSILSLTTFKVVVYHRDCYVEAHPPRTAA